MASGIVGRPLQPHNFNFLISEREYIQPVLVRSVNVKSLTNAFRSTANGSDKSSNTTLTSPVSETSLSASSSSWDITNDNSTDRTSPGILKEDRFDRQASRKVQLLFDGIESTLFEELSGDLRLQNECQEWRSAFPHLRVVGSTLVAEPEDPGFKHYDTAYVGQSYDASFSEETGDRKTTSNHNTLHSLAITGQPVRVCRPTTFITDYALEQRVNPDQEEIFAIEGEQEEILALDSSPQDIGCIKSRAVRKRRGVLSPPACWRNDIYNNIFNDTWTRIISSLRPLIAKYRQHDANGFDRVNESSPPGAAKTLVGMTSPSVSVTSSVKPVIVSDKSTRTTGTQLNGLLTIHSKTLLERDKQLDVVPIQRLRRPSTVLQQAVVPVSVSALDTQQPRINSSYRQFDRQGSGRRPVSRGRQLVSGSSDSSASVVEERVTDITMVRGHQLAISIDHNTHTSTVLPPLQSSLSHRNTQVMRRRSSRAISAVTAKSVQRDTMFVVMPSRPKTMQTFSGLSDIDRRSSTSFSFHSPRLTAVSMTPSTELAFYRRPKSQQQGATTDRQNTMYQEIRGIRLRRHNTISG